MIQAAEFAAFFAVDGGEVGASQQLLRQSFPILYACLGKF